MRIGFLSHSDMSIYYFRLPIMRALQKRGHEVSAIMPRGDYFDKVASEFNAVSYDIEGASLSPLKVAQNTLSLAAALRPLRLEMLQAAAHKSNIFGSMAAKSLGIKHIFCLVEGMGSAYTSDDLKTKGIRLVLENLYKTTLKCVKGCIFVNEADANYFLEKNLIEPKKLEIIKSVGVNCKEFDESKAKPSQQLADLKDKKIVLMMGRALVDKGVEEFYKAAEILGERKDCAFVFVGSSVEGKKGFDDDFLDGSSFVTHLKWSDDVKALLKSCYLFVLPSYREGFPRTILEAMAMSRPCVATDVVGCNEAVIDGRTGLLCKLKDADDLASKISQILDDRELAQIFASNARKIVLEKYDEHIITDRYIEFYRDFLDV